MSFLEVYNRIMVNMNWVREDMESDCKMGLIYER